jgi:hypothetical protein
MKQFFRETNKVAPLQAADLLAWENFHQFKTGIVRAPFMELCSRPLGIIGHGQFGMFTTPRLIEDANSQEGQGKSSRILL